MRKNILHFASHKGAEVYAILGSLVESCRMKGQSVLRYLERVIQEINNGNKDYDSLLPGVLTLKSELKINKIFKLKNIKETKVFGFR